MAGDAGPAEEGGAVTTRLGMELDERGVPIRSPFKHNPCNEAKATSFKCLFDNNYDNAKCEWAFEKYRECKKFWGEQKKFYREAMYKADRKDMFKF
eukprot:m.56424 g.56424  ORF g.56424 m.56424 type:complete len:96 (-) comp7674_c0_seq1:1781-2068(-)